MFNFCGKGRYVKTVFKGERHEIILFESIDKSQIIVHIGEEFEGADIMKSGNWVIAELKAKAKSKISSSGKIFFNTLIIPEKVMGLYDEPVSKREEMGDQLRETGNQAL
ncbi:hypothetical protein [Gudongella sp. DL1XJH-153]|uniref:hypothetical protein n=1 Tax=Gudongella sp. DL1XJH-153 TaxID=3409804 RepID=UPI003BB5D0A0